MRLLLAVLLLFYCSCDSANANGIAPAKNQETTSTPAITSNGSVKHYLKGSKTAAINPENEERAASSNPKPVSDKTPDDRSSKEEKQKSKDVRIGNPAEYNSITALKTIAKGQVKPLLVIVAISLIGGYLAYLVEEG